MTYPAPPPNVESNCPALSSNNQSDTDNDGTGDPCDLDTDNDGVLNEADTLDNVQTLVFNTMPVPQDIVVSTEAGQPAVFLEWKPTPEDDARIAGYRVMLVADDGTRIPLGSTPVPCFVDAGDLRHYVVTSYSANGVESAESEIASGKAAPPALVDGESTDALFTDSFE